MKKIYIYYSFIILICIYFIYYLVSTNYPINKKPSNYLSARFLAITIINKSNCVNLEYQGNNNGILSFDCQKEIGKFETSTYTIYTFSSSSIKNVFFKKIKEEGDIFKVGKYFLIKEHPHYGDSKSNKPRPITIESYKEFLGEIILP